MNKKGFTLVELLVVVILIAAIVLLALPKITNSTKNYNTNIDKTTLNIIKEATKLYVSNNENSFMKRSENTYCVSLNTLIAEDYLKNTIQYNNQDITNTKVMKVTYENGFNYELVNKKDCERVVKFDTVCEADSEQLYATNALDIGYKYNCKVDPDRPRYTFYVLSYNDENGNIITDKESAKSVNLIMDKNINSDGSPVTMAIPKTNPENGIYNLVPWVSKEDYLKSETGGTESEWDVVCDDCGNWNKGPITAINFLQEATKDWINTNEIKLDSFNDESVVLLYKTKPYYTHARMPYYYNEVIDFNGNNGYIYEYLNEGYWDYTESTKPVNNISYIYGYWILSVISTKLDRAWYVNYYGHIYGFEIYSSSRSGVRPVINLDI